MSDIKQGLWFKSAVSGLWYQNPQAAGTIGSIMSDGHLFEVKQVGPQESDPTECQYRNLAKQKHEMDGGDIEVDDDAIVSIGDDGAYVAAWTFVPKEEIERLSKLNAAHSVPEWAIARIVCEDCGPQFLNQQQYDQQMDQPHKGWRCPQCNCYPCQWDDAFFEARNT